MWWWAIRLLRMDRQVETTTSAEKVQRGRCYWARLLFSRSQPPRRAASRCCASRDTTCRGSATMRGKCCVDSHAFRDEGTCSILCNVRVQSKRQAPLTLPHLDPLLQACDRDRCRTRV